MAKKIYSDAEARQRKVQRQKEYCQRTHYAANNRYHKNAFSQLIVYENKDTTMAFKEKCKRLGISQRQVIMNAIEKFLEDNKVFSK